MSTPSQVIFITCVLDVPHGYDAAEIIFEEVRTNEALSDNK